MAFPGASNLRTSVVVDWYKVSTDDFARNKGLSLLTHYYGGSPPRAVMALVPGRNWCEWRFDKVPPGFWKVAENRQRYLRWLGKELGFRQPRDWYRLQAADIYRRYGGSLLDDYSSFYDLMREFLPELDWDPLAKAVDSKRMVVAETPQRQGLRRNSTPRANGGEMRCV